MIRILLMSDTHGYMDERILEHAAEADEVWHAGDIGPLESIREIRRIKPVRAVFGNIDGREVRQQAPLDNRFELDGLDVWMTHIGGYPGRYEPRVREILKVKPPGLFICGHSHILKVQFDQKYRMLTMNPGAAGMNGFHKVRTMLRFAIDQGEVKDQAVIELGPRGRTI